MDLATLLTFTKNAGASDLHLSAGAPPMCRVNGEMRKFEVEGEDLSRPDAIRRLIYGLLTDVQRKRLESDWELDCAMTVGEGGRFRANVFLQQRGLSAVIRAIPTKIKTADELGLPAAIRDLAGLDKGLVLVTGPTGSGKSTTLAALIDHINRTRRGHIITIEDPIEFVHTPKRCMVNQREVSAHTRAFKAALRSALREDPDVILVGEMRDLETMALAMTAAETGHLVFGTLHTSGAAQTVDRIINVFPPEEQAQIRAMLASSLQAVVSQVLVKRRSGGRVAAHEILIATSGARALIREMKSFQLPSIMQTGSRFGMITLPQALEALVAAGQVEQRMAQELLASLSAEGDDERFEHRAYVRVDSVTEEARRPDREAHNLRGFGAQSKAPPKGRTPGDVALVLGGDSKRMPTSPEPPLVRAGGDAPLHTPPPSPRVSGATPVVPPKREEREGPRE